LSRFSAAGPWPTTRKSEKGRQHRNGAPAKRGKIRAISARKQKAHERRGVKSGGVPITRKEQASFPTSREMRGSRERKVW